MLDFGKGGYEYIDHVPHQRWHLFFGRHHWLFRTKMRNYNPPVTRSGGNIMVFRQEKTHAR